LVVNTKIIKPSQHCIPKVGNPSSIEFYDASETHILLFFSNQNEGKREDTSTFLGALNCVPPPELVDTKFYQSSKLF
jgi:hypothetical protein